MSDDDDREGLTPEDAARLEEIAHDRDPLGMGGLTWEKRWAQLTLAERRHFHEGLGAIIDAPDDEELDDPEWFRITNFLLGNDAATN